MANLDRLAKKHSASLEGKGWIRCDDVRDTLIYRLKRKPDYQLRIAKEAFMVYWGLDEIRPLTSITLLDQFLDSLPLILSI